jgi:hypothetical protein
MAHKWRRTRQVFSQQFAIHPVNLPRFVAIDEALYGPTCGFWNSRIGVAWKGTNLSRRTVYDP